MVAVMLRLPNGLPEGASEAEIAKAAAAAIRRRGNDRRNGQYPLNLYGLRPFCQDWVAKTP